MLNANIIISEPTVESRNLLSDLLGKKLGYSVVAVASADAVIGAVYDNISDSTDVVLMDITANPAQSIETIEVLRIRFPNLPVIVLSNYGEMKYVSRALDAGAYDYLARPVSHKRLKLTMDNAVSRHRLAVEVNRLRCAKVTNNDCNYLPNNIPYMQNLLKNNVNSEKNVLMVGEQGVAKATLAKSIHSNSARGNDNFLSIDCSIMSDDELNSELFDEASSNGLSSKMLSLLGGTLFIDNVDNLSVNVQSKLFEFVVRSKLDIRFIAASSADMMELRGSDKLLPDFLQIFGGDIVNLPPLRDLVSEIPNIAKYFVERFALHCNPMVKGISPSAISLFESYEWPNNLRELELVIFRAVSSAQDSEIDVEHVLPYMPPSFAESASDLAGKQSSIMRSKRMSLTDSDGEVRCLQELEADMINFAFNFYEGRISEVARNLGIGRSTLYRKLNDLDIKVA